MVSYDSSPRKDKRSSQEPYCTSLCSLPPWSSEKEADKGKHNEKDQKSQQERNKTEREKYEISNNNSYTPEREKVEIPVPWSIYCGFEASEEGVVYNGGCSIVEGRADVKDGGEEGGFVKLKAR